MVTLSRQLGINLSLEQWQRSTGETGGDFVVIEQGPRHLRVFMADVTGHGDAAAAAAKRIRPMIERELRGGINGAKLRRLSKAAHDLLEERFVAFTCLEIDLVSGKASVIIAGNPAVIVRRDGGRFTEQLEANGMPLGLVDEDEWVAPSPQCVYLKPGDEFVCYTDGLTDTVGDGGGQRFGLHRVLSALSSDTLLTPVRFLSRCVQSFADRTADQDDLTLLWIGDAHRCAA